jgi:hypothetical protein
MPIARTCGTGRPPSASATCSSGPWWTPLAEMHPLNDLRSAAGTWRATYQLRDPANTLSSDSESRATVTPILGGREDLAVNADYARESR